MSPSGGTSEIRNARRCGAPLPRVRGSRRAARLPAQLRASQSRKRHRSSRLKGSRIASRVFRMQLRDPDLLRQQCFVGGKWIGTPETDVTDPATGAVIARVPRFGTAETRDAIA